MIPRSLLVLFASLLTACGEPNSDDLIEKANSLYQEKKYDEAIIVYTKAADADPTNAKILKFRGLSKSMTGDWAGCVEDLNSAIKIDPKNPDLLSTRAFSFLHTEDFEAAKRDFRAIDAIEKDAGKKAQYFMAESLLRRARSNLMTDKGDKQKALDDYNRVLAIAPANDIILFERADALTELKQYEAALKDLNKVIELDGDISKFGDTYIMRAKVRRMLKDEKGAEEDEAEAKRRSPP
jgi:tetratricopeptide (TPR) repeat protein